MSHEPTAEIPVPSKAEPSMPQFSREEQTKTLQAKQTFLQALDTSKSAALKEVDRYTRKKGREIKAQTSYLDQYATTTVAMAATLGEHIERLNIMAANLKDYSNFTNKTLQQQ